MHNKMTPPALTKKTKQSWKPTWQDLAKLNTLSEGHVIHWDVKVHDMNIFDLDGVGIDKVLLFRRH
jgi:hypothetical protein